MSSPVTRLRIAVVCSSLVLGFACHTRHEQPAPSSSPATSLPGTPGVGSSPAPPSPTSTAQLPQGPVLAILAGQGVGPIRIGATVPTIERLMEARCDVKTAEVCRYIVRAVEFHLDPTGVTNRITVHRKDRPAGLDRDGKPRAYGFFNGAIPGGAGLGMLPKAVLQILGPPERTERVTTPNDFHTIDRDSYPGMLLEYDEYSKDVVMLGGVIITKAK